MTIDEAVAINVRLHTAIMALDEALKAARGTTDAPLPQMKSALALLQHSQEACAKIIAVPIPLRVTR